MFSSRCETRLVPGMGSMLGLRLSIQASATWAAVALWALATLSTGPPGLAKSPEASGNQGIKPMPSRSQ
ncbi:MAG: hypothetical protein HLUCCA11_17695 [Phormidesmis priestleyi Ana]|uniref:Uncharacterized protein n=1 Tax=Phormidesmis priestleyi Ana TaxID=1666911 RepID=A0A0P7YSZ0_9CYAN|nr:MAG: hypothetical protein HLUCCA11_17695 [Phormidesmis priestleyi Ana]